MTVSLTSGTSSRGTTKARYPVMKEESIGYGASCLSFVSSPNFYSDGFICKRLSKLLILSNIQNSRTLSYEIDRLLPLPLPTSGSHRVSQLP